MFFLSLIILILIIIIEMGETAIVSLTKQQILAYHNEIFAKRLIKMKDNLDNLVVILLLFDSVLHFFLNFVIISFIKNFFGEALVGGLGTIFAVCLTCIGMLGKLYAIKYPNQTIFISYWVLYLFFLISRPILYLFNFIIDRKIVVNYDKSLHKRELMYYLDSHKTNDNIGEEVEMMKTMLSLKDITVNNVMTYKSMFIDVEFTENLEQMKRSILHVGCKKKIIIWEKHRDNILGTLDTREFFMNFIQNNITNIKYLIRPPKFFIDGTDLYKILQYFRVAKDKIAFIINEYGILLGVVTLTDIVNEIIGETDAQEEDFFEQLEENKVLVDGMYYLRTLNKKMDWDMPEEYLTVIGLIMNENNLIPNSNTIINVGPYELEVESIYQNKINRVIITYNPIEKQQA